MSNHRDQFRKRPLPTAVQTAIREGTRAPTHSDGAPREIDPDKEGSVPVDMNHNDATIYRLQRLEANDIEIARGLGDTNMKVVNVMTKVEVVEARVTDLVMYAAKADEREERRDAAKAARDAALETAKLAADAAQTTAKATEFTANVTLQTTKITSREKILLSILGIITLAVGGYFAAGHLVVK